MAPKKPPVTSSRTRQERVKNSGKAPASTPKPRQTAAGNRGAQAGPLKPGTRTSSSRQNSPRLPQLPKNPVRMPSSGAPTATTRRPMSPAAAPKPMAMRGAGRMGGPVAGTLLAAATPSVRRLGTAMGTKLGVALRPVGRAIDRAIGKNPKNKPKK